MELERRGIPTVTVCSHLFRRLGDLERRSLGLPDLPIAVTPHPIGGLPADAVTAKAEALLDTVIAGLTGPV